MSTIAAQGSGGGPALLIPPELDTEFAREYEQLRDQAGVATDSEEHELVLRLLEAAQNAGATPVGGRIHYLNPDQPVNYENDGVMVATTSRFQLNTNLRLALAVVALLIMAGVLGTSVFGWGKSPVGVGVATAVAAQTVTGTLTTTLTTPIPIGVVKIGQADLPPVYPQTLALGSQAWSVAVGVTTGGNWQITEQQNIANWMNGTVVNWVFGLFNDAEGLNSAALKRVQTGSLLELRMSSGEKRTFQLQAPQLIDRTHIEVLSQRKPGLTLLLVGGDTAHQRLWLQGTEVNSYGSAEPSP